jgi:hypothetical protein
VLAAGADQRTAMEQAARLSVDFPPLADPALLAIYRRQQELVWTEGLVERIEHELEAAGVLRRPGGSRPCRSSTSWATRASPKAGSAYRRYWPAPLQWR